MKAQAIRPSAELFNMLPFDEQIRLAMPIAKRLIIEGLDYGKRTDGELMSDLVCEIAGHPDLKDLIDRGSEELLPKVESWLEAARAIGMAIGFLVRPETFSRDRV